MLASIEAGLPYGVLAGNHDVGQNLEDYSIYSQFFGEDRFADNPWYGGSYQDNRGHYDLFSAGGIDFIVVSMGWGPNDESIAWMNEVLAQHPDRVAFINLHEYMLTTGGLGPIPSRSSMRLWQRTRMFRLSCPVTTMTLTPVTIRSMMMVMA